MAERARLLSEMERVTLAHKHVLYEPDQAIPHIYFPIDTVTSLLILMADGSRVEIGTVGNEGMVGLPVFLGAPMTTSQAITQIAGDALRLPTEVFDAEILRADSTLHRLLHRYTQAMFVQTAQGLACNWLHSVEQRFCRWMLLCHDRVRRDTFPLTQEFISEMLGVRRPGVSEVASAMQKAGLIRYHRGVMTILDHAALEAASCEC